MDNEKQMEQSTTQEFGEVTEPTAEQRPGHGRRTALIITGIVAVVAIIGIGVAAIILNQPKVQLARGVSRMTKELTVYGSPASKQINHALLQKNMLDTPHTLKADMTATFPQNDNISNLNLSVQIGQDNSNRLADMKFSAGAYQVSLVNGSAIVDNNTMYISAPKLLDDTYSLKLDTLGADYNASAWSKVLGLDVDPDASYDIFAQRKVDYTNAIELIQALAPDIQTLKDSIMIQRAPDKASIKTKNKSMQCNGVSITIPQETMNTFLSQFQQKFMASSMYQQKITEIIEQSSVTHLLEDNIRSFVDGKTEDIFGVRCMSDVNVNLYMDSKGRIVRIETPQAVEFKDSKIKSIELSADFTGEDRALDVISAQYKLNTVNGTKVFTVGRDASVTDEEYQENITLDIVGIDNTTALTMNYTNTWNLDTLAFDGALEFQLPKNTYKISADGSYQDIVEGKSYTLDLDTASFEINDEALFRVAGTISEEPGMEETEIPQSSVDLMQMDRTSIYDMFYKTLMSL